MMCTGYISFFVYVFLLHKQVGSCDPGYWLTENTECSLCPSNCELCTNITHCIKCKPEFWEIRPSMTCGSACHTNCTTSGCNDTTGHCHGCHPGFYGTYCENNCSLCLNSICDRWKCTQGCIEGYYEDALSEFHCKKCHGNCMLCKSQLECLRCPTGFYLFRFRSNIICSECLSACEECIRYGECTACRPGKYGATCSKDCNISNCKRCIEIDSVAKCTECRSGYTLQNGDCILGTTVCSQYCSTECESNGNCLGNCINGWTGPKCTDKCADKCRKCVQNDGTNCEICEGDYYTTTCNIPCNVHCSTLSETVTCNINNGTCLDGCDAGYWGDKCDNPCYEGCKSVSCDRHDGYCDICYRTYYGDACEKRFNDYCDDDRSSSEICNKKDGKCLHGCRFGNGGNQCNNETSTISTSVDISSTTGEIGEQYGQCDKHDSPEKLFLLGILTGVGVCLLGLVTFITILHIRRRRKQPNGSRNVLEQRAYENTGVTMQAVSSTETECGTENVEYKQTSDETSRSVYERLDGDRREDQHPYSELERSSWY